MPSYITGKKKTQKKYKGDSPTSHQTSTRQSEAKQQPQPVTQMPAVPTSRLITKVKRLEISLCFQVCDVVRPFSVYSADYNVTHGFMST